MVQYFLNLWSIFQTHSRKQSALDIYFVYFNTSLVQHFKSSQESTIILCYSTILEVSNILLSKTKTDMQNIEYSRKNVLSPYIPQAVDSPRLNCISFPYHGSKSIKNRALFNIIQKAHGLSQKTVLYYQHFLRRDMRTDGMNKDRVKPRVNISTLVNAPHS